MSLEAWGDEGDCGPDGYVTEERAEEMFVGGLQAMRESLAVYFEANYHEELGDFIRNSWNPGWGKDPGRPDKIAASCWEV